MDASRSNRTAFFRRPAGLAVALAAVGVLWACGDQNLFGPGQRTAPEIVDIQVPDEVQSGQTLDVRARAVGNVALDSIVVRIRGAFSDEETLPVPEGKLDATVDASFTVPETIADTTATVSAIAFDAQGNTSAITSATVRIVDTTPPSVSVNVGSNVVEVGSSFEVDVAASDNVGLREVGFRAFFLEGDTLVSETTGVSGLNAEKSFEFQVPEGAAEGELTVEAFATDADGNGATTRAGSPVQLVSTDDEPPTVSVSLPNETDGVVDVGEEILVHGQFSDNVGVVEIRFQGLAFRGDPEFGTDEVVVRFEEKVVNFETAVPDSLIKRFLQPSPADSTEERVHIIATVTDAQGNVGSDSTTIQLDADKKPPAVNITKPAEGFSHTGGDSLLVTANMSDESGIREVLFTGVALRGSVSLGTDEVVHRFESKTVTFSPAVGDTTLSRFLVQTADTTAEEVKIAVKATDSWGNVGTDTVTINVVAAPSPQPPRSSSRWIRTEPWSGTGSEWATMSPLPHTRTGAGSGRATAGGWVRAGPDR